MVLEVWIAQTGKDRCKGKTNELGIKEELHLVVKRLKDIKSFWESEYSIQSNEFKLPM